MPTNFGWDSASGSNENEVISVKCIRHLFAYGNF